MEVSRSGHFSQTEHKRIFWATVFSTAKPLLFEFPGQFSPIYMKLWREQLKHCLKSGSADYTELYLSLKAPSPVIFNALLKSTLG